MKGSQNGFTLAELVFVAGILSFTLVGMMKLYIYTSTQAEMAGNVTIAVSQAQNKLEEIRNHAYDMIATDYGSGGTPGNTFDLSILTGKGAVYIDSSNSELLVLEVVVSWMDKYNRIIGEDANLNGVLDGGEDANGNGKLDSPVRLMSMITER